MNLTKQDTVSCELLCSSNWEHLQQLYTGFSLLREKGFIRVEQRICKKDLIDADKAPHLRDAKLCHLEVLVNGHCGIYYDCHDSFEVDNEALSRANFYFKRSYSDKEIDKLNDKHKIFPLGFNLVVYGSGFDVSLLKRTTLNAGISKVRNLLLGMELDRVFGGKLYVDRVDDLEFYPGLDLPAKILFMPRAFNPDTGRSKQKRQEIESMNDTRAQCIRLLKKEFGTSFLGGFPHDDYAVTNFKDCLISNKNLAKKENYMQLLKQFPICVATTGLHGSIGWKVGEYISQAKAIVTEKLNYRVPGHFESGENYLHFVSPEDCVEASAKLFHDQRLRFKLMMNNYRYYHSYLRPDSLVLNTLTTALSFPGETISNRLTRSSLTATCDDTDIQRDRASI